MRLFCAYLFLLQVANHVSAGMGELVTDEPSQVKGVSVMHDPHTRESRGFGFVTMETIEEAS